MTENINADEQNTTQDVETTETEEGVATNSNEEVVSKAEYEKALAKAEKREGRYKSTMKKASTKDATTNNAETASVEELVDKKLARIKEEEAFIRKYWDEALDNVTSILEKYPNLTLEDAYKLSPAWQDPAATADTGTTTVVWTTWDVSWNSEDTITEEVLYKLPDAAYAAMRDKIDAWIVKIVA